MINIKILTPLVGTSFVIDGETEVENWEAIKFDIPLDATSFTLAYNNYVYNGTLARSEDNLKLLVLFAEHVALPSGLCMMIECQTTDVNEDCITNQLVEITDETKLMVLNSEGCPAAYLTVGNLKEYLRQELVQPDWCEMIGGFIPQGNLVASDRILTTSGGCTLKSVPITDINCE